MSDWFKMSFEQKQQIKKKLFSIDLTPSDVLGDVRADIKFQLLLKIKSHYAVSTRIVADAQNMLDNYP